MASLIMFFIFFILGFIFMMLSSSALEAIVHFVILYLLSIYPSFCNFVKRSHDIGLSTDKAGFYFVLVNLASFFLIIYRHSLKSDVFWGLSIILILIISPIFLADGVEEANEYGNKPV